MTYATDIAWATGLFEGEGTIRTRATSAIELSLSTTDLDVLERFHDLVGIGKIEPRRRTGAPAHHKPQWTWTASRTHECIALLQLMLPLLGERRAAKAREVIATAEGNRWRTCYCGRSFYTASAQRTTCSSYCSQALADAKRRPRKTAPV